MPMMDSRLQALGGWAVALGLPALMVTAAVVRLAAAENPSVTIVGFDAQSAYSVAAVRPTPDPPVTDRKLSVAAFVDLTPEEKENCLARHRGETTRDLTGASKTRVGTVPRAPGVPRRAGQTLGPIQVQMTRRARLRALGGWTIALGVPALVVAAGVVRTAAGSNPSVAVIELDPADAKTGVVDAELRQLLGQQGRMAPSSSENWAGMAPFQGLNRAEEGPNA